VSPLVSVVVPCFNAERFLQPAILSCLNQTWDRIELLIVDDGSTDDSLAIAKAAESARCKVFKQNHRGAAAARNLGLSMAQGDFIQYLDADDLIAPDKIDRQIRCLAECPDHVASCEWGRFQTDPAETKFVPEEVWRDFDPAGFVISSWLGGGMMPPIAWLTPRYISDKAGPWNDELSLNDDGEYFTRVLLASRGVRFCKGARCFYRSGSSNSLSARKDRAALTSAYRAAELASANLLAYADNAITRMACAWQFRRFAYDAYPGVPDLVTVAEQRCAELGGSRLKPGGGRAFQLTARLVGWKVARHAQVAWRSTMRRGAGAIHLC
jgi:glycosyltransferase involved in cell wall biosynthesis